MTNSKLLAIGGAGALAALVTGGLVSVYAQDGGTGSTTFAQRSFTFTAMAGTGDIRFSADGSSGDNRAVFLDAVIVEFVPLVPEPTSLVLLGLGTCGLFCTRRRNATRKS